MISTLAVLFSAFACGYDYYDPFPGSKYVLASCSISYFILTGILQLYQYVNEVFSKLKTLQKCLGGTLKKRFLWFTTKSWLKKRSNGNWAATLENMIIFIKFHSSCSMTKARIRVSSRVQFSFLEFFQTFDQKKTIEIWVKHLHFWRSRNFGQRLKFWLKIQILVKNSNFGQKLKCWSKIKILVKYWILVKSLFWYRSRTLGQKSKFSSNQK